MQFRYFLSPGFRNERDIELTEAARVIINTCLQVMPDEQVAIITDTMQSTRLVETLAMACNLAGAEYTIAIAKPRKSMYGPKEITEPPKPVAGALMKADAALLVGTTGILWTDAVQNALKQGTRILSAPGISEDNFYRCVLIDYDQVWTVTKRIQDVLHKGEVLSVTSPQGTCFTAELAYPPRWDCDGRVSKPGDFDFLPTGIAQFGFKENTAHGRIVIDGAFSRVGVLREPIVVQVEKGRRVHSEGGFEKKEFEDLMGMFGDPNVSHLSAFATGTNPMAKFVGQPNEDERVIGMMTLFWGDSFHVFGGGIQACMYLIATLTSPTIKVGGLTIVEAGFLKI